ncbi:hypothetical protein C8Q77DRAFT_577303 [Trametes polyzona]|nr:hypothetical protein C8Q77DRAFT_577303 [Trametes polyzona]
MLYICKETSCMSGTTCEYRRLHATPWGIQTKRLMMPSLRLLRRMSSGDVIAATISSLELLKETSNTIAVVPFLGDIIGVVLGIAKTVERIRGDRERYIRLARCASELLRHIEDTITADPDTVDDKLRRNLEELHALLVRIEIDIQTQLGRSPLARLLLQASTTQMLEDRTHQLECAWRAFDTACLIDLRMKAATQAIYDPRTQLRLFRRNEIKCYRVRGTYQVAGRDIGEEWEVSTHHHDSLVTYYPNIHHPYIAQVIGYSHPSIPERFYVMDTGVIPVLAQFQGKDIQIRTLQWLQHVVDYQTAFHHVERLGLPVSECHSHDGCLPSAMLNEEGRLIVDAADFCDSNLGCFQYLLRTLYDEVNGPPLLLSSLW